MADSYQPLLSEAFRDSPEDVADIARLRAWNGCGPQTETQAEVGFLKTFFFDLWGYWPDG